jgi:hypothetical protein
LFFSRGYGRKHSVCAGTIFKRDRPIGKNGDARLVRQIVLEDMLLIAGGTLCAFVLGRAASGILVRWVSNRSALFAFDLHPNLFLVLLATQASLSLLLSTMSACFAATLVHWETVDVGMEREQVLIVRPELHQPRYADRSEMLPELFAGSVATLIPARRAAFADPLETHRSE